MPISFKRGTNISHWLSQSKQRGEARKAFFTKEDVQRIAAWGFDHIRLPIDEEQMWDQAGRPESEAWDLMNSALDWSVKAGLGVIVDLHILRSHYFITATEPKLFTDPAEEQRFASLWTDLSKGLSSRSVDRVAYELMNEAVATNPGDWNRVAHTAFSAIRQREVDRVIVLGSNRWNSATTFDQLSIPDDRNQILTFHYYLPMLITHYTASWTPSGQYAGPVTYPGKPVSDAELVKQTAEIRALVESLNEPYDRNRMIADLAQPLAARKQTGLPLYCGEFGVFHKCPAEPRMRWYKDFISVLNEFNIGWGNWDYRGGFGIVTGDGQSTGVAEAMLLGK